MPSHQKNKIKRNKAIHTKTQDTTLDILENVLLHYITMSVVTYSFTNVQVAI